MNNINVKCDPFNSGVVIKLEYLNRNFQNLEFQKIELKNLMY
jgi:hypothetical protein